MIRWKILQGFLNGAETKVRVDNFELGNAVQEAADRAARVPLVGVNVACWTLRPRQRRLRVLCSVLKA